MKTAAKMLAGIFFALVAAFGVFGYLTSAETDPAHVFWGMIIAAGVIPLAVFWWRGAR